MSENKQGYEELTTGVFVSEEDAFDYAIEQCLEVIPEGIHNLKWIEEFKESMVEWFYSGNWIKVPCD